MKQVKLPDDVYMRLKALAGKDRRTFGDTIDLMLDREEYRQLEQADVGKTSDTVRNVHTGVIPMAAEEIEGMRLPDLQKAADSVFLCPHGNQKGKCTTMCNRMGL